MGMEEFMDQLMIRDLSVIRCEIKMKRFYVWQKKANISISTNNRILAFFNVHEKIP